MNMHAFWGAFLGALAGTWIWELFGDEDEPEDCP